MIWEKIELYLQEINQCRHASIHIGKEKQFEMIGKIEIDEARKNRIIKKAGHLADEIGVKLMACAPATFAAICDAFKSEDIELFPPEMQEILTQGMMGLHGGIALTGVGTCGAITASTFIISCVVGVTTEEL